MNTINNFIQSYEILLKNLQNIDIQQQMSRCTVLGDMGYIFAEYQLNLFEKASITPETSKRRDEHNYRPQPYIFRKSRKRIETLYSQLCTQFMIRRKYAKTFEGFKTRVLSKISAMTMIQYHNWFVFHKPINNLKINLY